MLEGVLAPDGAGLVLLGGGGCGGCGGGGWFGDGNGERLLVVEVEGKDCVGAGVPGSGSDGEVDNHEALYGLLRIDAGLAKKQRGVLGGGEFADGGKAGVEVFELGVLDGAGGGLKGAVGRNEGGGDVFKEEREAKAVGDADGDEGVEIVLRGIVADDDGIGFEDGMGGEDVDVGDGDIRSGARGETEEEEAGEAKEHQREEDGDGEVSALGLGEGEIGHGLRIAVQAVRCREAGVSERAAETAEEGRSNRRFEASGRA